MLKLIVVVAGDNDRVGMLMTTVGILVMLMLVMSWFCYNNDIVAVTGACSRSHSGCVNVTTVAVLLTVIATFIVIVLWYNGGWCWYWCIDTANVIDSDRDTDSHNGRVVKVTVIW